MDNNEELENLKEAISKQNPVFDSDQLKSEPMSYMRKYKDLTYDEAMQYLKEGTAVKLPEWLGMWFPVNDKIFVFTKDNEILATPQHDTYSIRNDWTTTIGDIPDLQVRFIKTLRLKADSLLNHVNSGEAGSSREISLAVTSIQLGFMWLGLELGHWGSANPYPKSMDASSPVIEKHADKTEDDLYGYISSPDFDQTAKVKALRSELQTLISFVEYIGKFNRSNTQAWAVASDKFIEGKLWLGQQLNNIRVAGLKA